MKPPTIIEFCTDPQLLGLSLSPAQATLLKSSYGEPLDDEELDIFRTCTGRARYPGHRFPEVTVVAGARSGKDSRIAATTVLYESVFGGHEAHVAKGETGTIVLVAQDAKAVGVAFTYIATYLQRSPVLAGLLDGEPLTNSLRLRNGLVVQGFPCTLRSMRGYSIVCAVLDELSFFRLEGQADSDAEIQASVRRGMINFANARLVKVSTPYMRSGVLFDDFQRGFGQDDPDLLVWKASTTLMNPTITEARLDRERRVDPLRFSREYEAEFAEDVESFLPAAWVDAVVVPRRHELPPLPGVRYTMAADPSGGGADAFTAAVVHPEGTGASRKIVVDVCRGWSRPRGGQVDLDSIVGEIASIATRYGCSTIYGDRYAGQWVRESFRRHAVTYSDAEIKKAGEPTPVYLDKSTAYAEVEPLFATGMIELLDHPQLLRELKNLERRPRAGGKPLIDHPRGSHDDHANALAIAAAKARGGSLRPMIVVPEGIARIGEPSSTAVARSTGQAAYARRGDVAGQARWLRGMYR